MAQRSSEVRSVVIPPPVNGWSTKQPISNMDPTYSPEMENWFPKGGTVDLRKGCRQHSKGLSGNAGTIAEYVDGASARYLIAFLSDSRVFNCTSSGTATAIDNTGTRLVDYEVYTCNFQGRIFIKGYTGATDVYYWPGSGQITLAGFTGPSGDDKALWRITSYKKRLYFVERGDAAVWYAGVDAITGALTEFPLQSILTLGGQIWYIGSFSLTGDSSQELFCIISEQGEVILYQGDYPDAATWSKVGHYFIPAPMGRRCFIPWGSDIVVITKQGVLSLREAIAAPNSEFTFLSDEINDKVLELFDTAATNPEFINGIIYPAGPYLLINLPGLSGNNIVQLIMNLRTRAWTKFTNQEAYHWCLFNNALYFGTTNGKVFKADYNTSDTSTFDEDPASEGNAKTRTTVLRHSFNYFGDTKNTKQMVDARPIIYASNGLTIKSGVDVDYTDTDSTSTFTDTSDTTYKLYRPKLGLTGIGKCASYRIDQISVGRVSLQATEIFYQQGDV